jgi:hypothetical protein
MNGFKIGKFVIVGVDADAEKQASISSVHNFVVPELVCWLASGSKCSQRSTPQQNLTDTSGLVGQLLYAPPHVTEPTSEREELRWSVSCIGPAAHFLIVVVRYIPF